jgi:hypothetical protein
LLSSFRTGSLSFAKIAELPPVPAKIVKAEKKTGACSQFSEAYPIFCKDSQSRVSHQIIRMLAAVFPEPVLSDRDSHLPEMPSNISGNPDFGCLRWIFR